MSNTVIEQGFARIEDSSTAPAVWKDGWLPDTDVFPELSEARAEYLRLRRVWQSAGARRRELESQIEADTERRKAALRDAMLAGETDPQLEVEDPALKNELAQVNERSNAAMKAYVEHINNCIALVVAHRSIWMDEITAFQANVDSEVQALIDQATALRSKRGDFGRLEHWLDRVVAGAESPYVHIGYSEIPAKPSGDAAEEEAALRKFMLASYAGGIAPDAPATEEQGRALVEGNIASQKQKPVLPEETREVDVEDLADDELVDWIMGAGMFDGQPKPTEAAVVEAGAEGGPALAERLLVAEQTAGGDAPRQEAIDGLTKITNGKVSA